MTGADGDRVRGRGDVLRSERAAVDGDEDVVAHRVRDAAPTQRDVAGGNGSRAVVREERIGKRRRGTSNGVEADRLRVRWINAAGVERADKPLMCSGSERVSGARRVCRTRDRAVRRAVGIDENAITLKTDEARRSGPRI